MPDRYHCPHCGHLGWWLMPSDSCGRCGGAPILPPPVLLNHRPEPVIGYVGQPDATGRALVTFTEEGRRLYGPNVTMYVEHVRPVTRPPDLGAIPGYNADPPAADEPTVVTAEGGNG